MVQTMWKLQENPTVFFPQDDEKTEKESKRKGERWLGEIYALKVIANRGVHTLKKWFTTGKMAFS